MKLIFKITTSAANAVLNAMSELSQEEYYATFRGNTWITTGGNRYIVDPINNTLTYIGSRTSFADGAGFGGICRNANGNYRVYLWKGYSSSDYPLKLSAMETTWENVPGYDDPFCTESELVTRQEQEQEEEQFEEYCAAIELLLS